jgi:hypothetical protein
MDELFWKQVNFNFPDVLVREIEEKVQHQKQARNEADSSVTVDRGSETSRVLEGMSSLKAVALHNLSADSNLPTMEGHSGCGILNRFCIYFAGWGQAQSEEVSIIDGDALPQLKVVPSVKSGSAGMRGGGRVKYCFSTATAECLGGAWTRRVIIFGGLTGGGYTGSINGKLAHHFSTCVAMFP